MESSGMPVPAPRLDDAEPERKVRLAICAEARRARDGDDPVDECRVPHGPLQRLHATHGDADDSIQVIDAEVLGQQAMLGVHHVANRERREASAGTRSAIRGRGGRAVRQRVHDDDVERARVQEPGRSEQGDPFSERPANQVGTSTTLLRRSFIRPKTR